MLSLLESLSYRDTCPMAVLLGSEAGSNSLVLAIVARVAIPPSFDIDLRDMVEGEVILKGPLE